MTLAFPCNLRWLLKRCGVVSSHAGRPLWPLTRRHRCTSARLILRG